MSVEEVPDIIRWVVVIYILTVECTSDGDNANNAPSPSGQNS